jgi:23S rRNA G2069 N7-methylase RlmK/C1962 C5-methylase RlmI
MVMKIEMNIGGMPHEEAMRLFKEVAPGLNGIMQEMFKDICTIKVELQANRIETGQKKEG